MRYYQGMTVQSPINIDQSMHSPSYEFVFLHDLFKSLRQREQFSQSKAIEDIHELKNKLDQLWSFNPPNHLPYAREYSYLPAGLTGLITNHQGDYAVRFGLGYQGQSLEIRQYNFGNERKVPSPALAGAKAYTLIFYPESELFEGRFQETAFLPENPLWRDINKRGFIASAVDFLKNRNELVNDSRDSGLGCRRG